MKDQFPTKFQFLDDSKGINWRILNALKRLSVKRTGRLFRALALGREYTRPIFVVGASRSGTTLLFYLFQSSDELSSLPTEGHNLWRTFHHPRYSGWGSDQLNKDNVLKHELRFANAYFYSYGIESPRFVEKTPENILRISYLLELYPDALFVAIKRNPGDVINSLINGWRHPEGRFRSYYVPEVLSIPDYPHRHQWCFTLINGWRDLKNASIPRIATAQWTQMSNHLIKARDIVPESQWYELYFEDLIDNPEETVTKLLQYSCIQYTTSVAQRLEILLHNPPNQLSQPGHGKWKNENGAEFACLIPEIASLARRLGYEYDESENDFRIVDSAVTE